VDAGKLDDDLVPALLADLGLGHAEPVDAVPHDRDRAVEVRAGDFVVRLVLRRFRLEHHFQATLEVEAEGRLALDR